MTLVTRPAGRSSCVVSWLILAGLALAPAAAHSLGVVVGTLPVDGGAPNGGVVALADGTVFVGEGGNFTTGGTARLLRIAPGGATTQIAHGFNSISGLAYDAATDTLYAGDNGGELAGATTGDTVFAIPDAFDRAASVSVSGLEAAPAGSVPFAADVILGPSGDLFVSDAAGAGTGRVLRIAAGVATPLIGGLDFVGGLVLDGSSLLVGDTSASTFLGSVHRYALDGSFVESLAVGLPGAFDLDFTPAGDLLASGGSFLNSPIISIAPGGTVSTLIDGFVFTTAFDVRDSDGLIFLLDSGASAITLVAIPEPGGAALLAGPLAALALVRGGRRMRAVRRGCPAAEEI